MTHIAHDISVASQIGSYCDGAETASGLRWLHTSGTPGLGPSASCPRISKARRNWPEVLLEIEIIAAKT